VTLQLTKKHSFDTVYDSQKVFRLILEAMSNPARVVNISDYAIKLFGEKTERTGHTAVFTTRSLVFLALSMTLLDNEVSFNACENQSLTDEIVSLTLAKRETIEAADFVFVCEPNDTKNVIESVKCGTLSDPHKSATVIIRNDGEPTCPLTLSGPGIDGNITIQTTQTVKEAIELRDAQNYEYPQGIDLIFVSGKGELFAIPRLTRMEVY
jgi:alpha-D-ribose 1-methylphosphonate 5-triphosphate synthase subunit PhnH